MATIESFSNLEGFEIDKPPFFDGVHFDFWKTRMECYLQSIDLDLWDIVLDGFSSKPKLNWDSYDKKCFTLNIRAMQILRYGLNDDIYARIKNCSSAKDIWDTLDAIYLANNVFEQNVVSRKQEEQKPLEKEHIGMEHALETLMDNHMEEDDDSHKSSVLEAETTSYMAQEDFEVNYTSIDNSPSYDEIQYAYDELNDGLINLEKKNLACLKSISSIEIQIETLKNEYAFLDEEILMKCETSTNCENCIDLENQVEDLFSKVAQIESFTCSHSMCDNKRKTKDVLHGKSRKTCGKNILENDYTKRHKFFENDLQKTKPSSHSIVCNYCGHLGHISHLCKFRRNSYMRNNMMWVPKTLKGSNTNIEGPKLKWVPKSPPSASIVQKISQKDGLISKVK